MFIHRKTFPISTHSYLNFFLNYPSLFVSLSGISVLDLSACRITHFVCIDLLKRIADQE